MLFYVCSGISALGGLISFFVFLPSHSFGNPPALDHLLRFYAFSMLASGAVGAVLFAGAGWALGQLAIVVSLQDRSTDYLSDIQRNSKRLADKFAPDKPEASVNSPPYSSNLQYLDKLTRAGDFKLRPLPEDRLRRS
jgi:hypothetical protein